MDAKYWVGRLQHRAFPTLERWGYHVTPVDYYQPIPDTRTLSQAVWQPQSELAGVDLRESEQVDLVTRLGSSFAAECRELPRAPEPGDRSFYFGNGWFDSIDAELLYGMIRHFKPRRVIEIGSGFSTLMASAAARANWALDEHLTKIHAIEPHPRDFVVKYAGDRWRLTSSPVEDVPLSVFTELEADDILFIDSSHVVRIGGDVLYEFLEVIPRLAPGVIIHVHDIFFPHDYPREWVMARRRFWTEQYLLRAFLMFNREFEVLASASLLHARHPDVLSEAFSAYPPGDYRPASFWMRRASA